MTESICELSFIYFPRPKLQGLPFVFLPAKCISSISWLDKFLDQLDMNGIKNKKKSCKFVYSTKKYVFRSG